MMTSPPTGLLKFQSTHPVRGATRLSASVRYVPSISIHAPRAGCDDGVIICRLLDNLFQSTHPVRGATVPTTVPSVVVTLFQSTHPVRGATMAKI